MGTAIQYFLKIFILSFQWKETVGAEKCLLETLYLPIRLISFFAGVCARWPPVTSDPREHQRYRRGQSHTEHAEAQRSQSRTAPKHFTVLSQVRLRSNDVVRPITSGTPPRRQSERRWAKHTALGCTSPQKDGAGGAVLYTGFCWLGSIDPSALILLCSYLFIVVRFSDLGSKPIIMINNHKSCIYTRQDLKDTKYDHLFQVWINLGGEEGIAKNLRVQTWILLLLSK